MGVWILYYFRMVIFWNKGVVQIRWKWDFQKDSVQDDLEIIEKTVGFPAILFSFIFF